MKPSLSLSKNSVYAMFGFLGLIFTSCGSYQNTTNDDRDGIYGGGRRPVENRTNNVQYQNYFGSLQDTPPQDQIFTDVENYSSNNYDDANRSEEAYSNGYGGWGSNPEHITVNVYDNSWGWGGGLGWGWNNYWGAGWGWNLGWGWNSWYGPNYYGWGYAAYPYYGYGYNGWYQPYYGGYASPYYAYSPRRSTGYRNVVTTPGRSNYYNNAGTRGRSNNAYYNGSRSQYNNNVRNTRDYNYSNPRNVQANPRNYNNANNTPRSYTPSVRQSTPANSTRSYAPAQQSRSSNSGSYSPAPSRSYGGGGGGGFGGGGRSGGGGGRR